MNTKAIKITEISNDIRYLDTIRIEYPKHTTCTDYAVHKNKLYLKLSSDNYSDKSLFWGGENSLLHLMAKSERRKSDGIRHLAQYYIKDVFQMFKKYSLEQTHDIYFQLNTIAKIDNVDTYIHRSPFSSKKNGIEKYRVDPKRELEVVRLRYGDMLDNLVLFNGEPYAKISNPMIYRYKNDALCAQLLDVIDLRNRSAQALAIYHKNFPTKGEMFPLFGTDLGKDIVRADERDIYLSKETWLLFKQLKEGNIELVYQSDLTDMRIRLAACLDLMLNNDELNWSNMSDEQVSDFARIRDILQLIVDPSVSTSSLTTIFGETINYIKYWPSNLYENAFEFRRCANNVFSDLCNYLYNFESKRTYVDNCDARSVG